jgi:hypothetical protein
MLYCAISTVRSPINIIKPTDLVGFIIVYYGGN